MLNGQLAYMHVWLPPTAFLRLQMTIVTMIALKFLSLLFVIAQNCVKLTFVKRYTYEIS